MSYIVDSFYSLQITKEVSGTKIQENAAMKMVRKNVGIRREDGIWTFE